MRRTGWFEFACGLTAIGVLGSLLLHGTRSGDWPRPAALALFALLLVASENAAVLLPSSVRVSPAFMVVMASIAAYGDHGVLLGAFVTGMCGGLAWPTIAQRKARVVVFNCSQ